MNELLAHCIAAFDQHGGKFAVFFLGGLTGSLTHCLAMCGPIVACQSACGGSCGKKMPVALQLHYHLGRLLTYGALGFCAALLSRQVMSFAFWPYLSSAIMVLAALLFIASAVFPTHHRFSINSRSNFLRGVFMSFMPCGLIYAALMMAATLADPLYGMVAMWLFVLGTIPVLMLTSSFASLLSRQWQNIMNGAGRLGMAFNGLALLAMVTHVVR